MDSGSSVVGGFNFRGASRYASAGLQRRVSGGPVKTWLLFEGSGERYRPHTSPAVAFVEVPACVGRNGDASRQGECPPASAYASTSLPKRRGPDSLPGPRRASSHPPRSGTPSSQPSRPSGWEMRLWPVGFPAKKGFGRTLSPAISALTSRTVSCRSVVVALQPLLRRNRPNVTPGPKLFPTTSMTAPRKPRA